jgi:hypothetical protein
MATSSPTRRGAEKAPSLTAPARGRKRSALWEWAGAVAKEKKVVLVDRALDTTTRHQRTVPGADRDDLAVHRRARRLCRHLSLEVGPGTPPEEAATWVHVQRGRVWRLSL